MGTLTLTTTFAVYLVVSIGLTGWLAVELNRNGKIFLRDVFHDEPQVGEAVNRLLTIGFFMISLGYAFLILRAESVNPSEDLLPFLVNRLGLLLVSLGVLHFINMAVFAKIRQRAQLENYPPPVPPQVLLPPDDDPDPQPRAQYVGPNVFDRPDDRWAEGNY
jgi:hypothetical protein